MGTRGMLKLDILFHKNQLLNAQEFCKPVDFM